MTVEDFSQPVLPGQGASDYERYLRTDELLALQKTPEEWVHRDELLFQTVHQSSELWLKLACAEVAEATEQVGAGELATAARLLRRAALSISFITRQLDMLEQLSPWEYQTIRRVLGHGSGFDSPGFRQIRRVSPPLWEAFVAAGLDPVEVYRSGDEACHPAGRGADRVGRVDRGLARQALPDGRADHRRARRRHPGHAGRGARAPDHEADVPGALDGA